MFPTELDRHFTRYVSISLTLFIELISRVIWQIFQINRTCLAGTMNLLRNSLSCVRSFYFLKNATVPLHSSSLQNSTWSPSFFRSNAETFLHPTVAVLNHSRGMKHKDVVKKRCESCYFMWKDGRKYNYCRKKPKHNQVSRVPKDIARYIITTRTWGRRPW